MLSLTRFSTRRAMRLEPSLKGLIQQMRRQRVCAALSKIFQSWSSSILGLERLSLYLSCTAQNSLKAWVRSGLIWSGGGISLSPTFLSSVL